MKGVHLNSEGSVAYPFRFADDSPRPAGDAHAPIPAELIERLGSDAAVVRDEAIEDLREIAARQPEVLRRLREDRSAFLAALRNAVALAPIEQPRRPGPHAGHSEWERFGYQSCAWERAEVARRALSGRALEYRRTS